MSEKECPAKEELDALKIEYANLFDRSTKIDNKVYITITFLGFMFVFITGLFSAIPMLHFTGSALKNVLQIAYLISTVAVIISYVLNLIFFLRLLHPEGIERMDPDRLSSLELKSCSYEESLDKLSELYRQVISRNLVRLHERCDTMVAGNRKVIVTVILAFVTFGIQVVLQMV